MGAEGLTASQVPSQVLVSVGSPEIYLVPKVDAFGLSPGRPHFLHDGGVWTLETQKSVNLTLASSACFCVILRTAACGTPDGDWEAGGVGWRRDMRNSGEGGIGENFDTLSCHVVIRKQLQRVSVTCSRLSRGPDTELAKPESLNSQTHRTPPTCCPLGPEMGNGDLERGRPK